MKTVLFPSYTIGEDCYDEIKRICAPFGTKIGIIGGEKALHASGDKIVAAATEAGFEVVGPFWYGGEASYENIEMLMPKLEEADMIFAVGGGKAIDTGKVIGQRSSRPFFTFPTIASTCAAVTSLGIIYHPDGSLHEYSFSDITPNHVFIDPQVIANAPSRYFWAGIGDTMAKYYEPRVSSRGRMLESTDASGVALCVQCGAPIVKYGAKALEDCKNHVVSHELEEVILSIIITTGIVSNFVQVDYTTGLAHATYNGTTALKSTEEHHHLHGEVVGYGVLVLLTIDEQFEERERIFKFNKSLGLPTKLADIHANVNDIETIVDKALKGIDLRIYPYEVNKEVFTKGIMDLEKYNENN